MVRGITHILKNDSTIQSVVGQNKAGAKYKVYPGIAGQSEEVPYSVVRQTSKSPVDHKIGRKQVFIYTYSVASYHTNYEDAEELDQAVQEALDNVAGTFNTVAFRYIRYTNSFDGEPDEQGNHSRVSTYEAVVHEDQTT